jgi:hypothetical protein
MHTTPRKRWMEIKDFEILYPEDIANCKEELLNEW